MNAQPPSPNKKNSTGEELLGTFSWNRIQRVQTLTNRCLDSDSPPVQCTGGAQSSLQRSLATSGTPRHGVLREQTSPRLRSILQLWQDLVCLPGRNFPSAWQRLRRKSRQVAHSPLPCGRDLFPQVARMLRQAHFVTAALGVHLPTVEAYNITTRSGSSSTKSAD